MRKIIFSTIFIILTILGFYPYSHAETTEELKIQIDSANSQIEKLNREIAVLSGQIAKTAEQKKTLANAILDLTLKKNKLVKEREQTEKKINATGLVIKTLNSEIVVKDIVLNKSKESLANLIKNLNQQDNQTLLQKLLSENSLNDFSREYNNIISLNSEIKNHINNVTIQKQDLTNTKTKKEDEKEALTILKKNLTTKELEILANKKEKDTLLVETKNKESNYKKLLADTEKRKQAFEKAIEDYEAKIKFILNPNSLPKEGSGVLSWPLDSILVTSNYGSRCLINLYGKCKFHYGLDFRASVGTSVKAMATGTVMGIGDTDIACKGASFGKWVFIKYENGLSSTYGHLSSISAKVGDKVKAGDIVAYSGNTGSSTGPHLHVGVHASGGVKVDTVPSKSCGGKIFTQPISALSAYLDPAKYLPPITASMVKK